MSNYTKTTDFEAKDSLPTGDSGKIIRGSEFETEFDAISTAIATKADTAGPTFTGTLTFETISDGSINVTAFVDEDDMVSDSATLVPTQQSVKAYVDSQVTAQDLDFQGDTGGALSIDLDSESLTVAGGTGIDTAGAGNTLTVNIDSTVATLTGTQTLTNKTLTTPTISGNLTTDGTIDGRDVAADGTKLDGIESGATADQTAAEIRTLVDSATDSNVFTDADHTKLDGIEANATADQTAAEIRTLVDSATDSNVFTDADHTKLDGIEASADVTDTANVTAAGALMDSELTSEASVKALDQGVATTDSPTFAGLTTTADVSFGDNDKAVFGAGSDLQIYHDGSHSYIKDAGTGNLNIQANQLRIQSDTGENFIECVPNAQVVLRYDNGVKLQTTSTGVDVTGTITADGLDLGDASVLNVGTIALDTIKGDADDNTNITFAGSDTTTFTQGGTQRLAVNPTGINVTGTVTADGLTVDGNPVINDASPQLFFQTGATHYNWQLAAQENVNQAFEISSGALDAVASNDTYTKRFVIESSGDISFYEDTGTTAKLFWDASAESLGIGTSSPSFGLSVESDNGSGYAALFRKSSSDPALTIQTTSSITQIQGLNSALSATNDIAMQLSGGNVGIGTSSPSKKLHVKGTGSTAAMMLESSNSSNGQLTFKNTSTTNNFIVGLLGDTSGDALLYHGDAKNMQFWTNNTERMRIDSSGNVGIGTSTGLANGTLNVKSNGTSVLQARSDTAGVNDGDTTVVVSRAVNSTAAKWANAIYRGYSHAWSYGFNAATTEAMRIDSSGNLLVGTTTTSRTTAGHELHSNGFARHTASNDKSLEIVRTTGDGEMVEFFKDSTLVGSIGTNSGYLVIGSPVGSDGHLLIGNNLVHPATSTGAGKDAVIDIGGSSNRFRDLYLSGGVYLGGTGSANKLDDYEEGTWTPTINAGTISATNAVYTKIGNLVTVRALIADFSNNTSTANIEIGGLPFTSSSDNRGVGTAMSRYFSRTDALSMVTYIDASTSTLELYWSFNSSTAWDNVSFDDGTNANMDLIFTISYKAA